jgi:tRNA(adenine34) deaminase
MDRELIIIGDQVADDQAAMQLALRLAVRAAELGEVPVGAVVIRDGVVIAARHNERETSQDPTAHAEVLALRDAAHAIGQWRLNECTLVVTLEPCVMCAGALMNARVARLVYGAADLKGGATASLYNVCADPRLNHEPVVIHGVCEQESASLLRVFFSQKRN